jgi:hypothetical protein
MSTTPPTEKPGFVSWLAANRGAAGIVLMLAGIGVAVLPTLLVSWYHTDYWGTVVCTGLLAVLLLGVGVYLKFLPPGAADQERVQMILLVLGGLGGLLITGTGLALTYHWWDQWAAWLGRGEREGAGKILGALTVLIAGLAIMFVGLQLGRTEERTHAGLRRLVYGYNAVLTGVLLLLILGVINVLVGVKYAGALDATSSREYSISERTSNLISGLDRPLHLYVIWNLDDPILVPLRALLSGFEDRSRNVTVTYMSPTYDVEALTNLVRKFPRKIERVERGVLVVLGDEKPENAAFLRRADLFETDFQEQVVKFKAEDAIAAAITNLEGGAAGGKTIVYFTQGLGEPDLNDANPRDLDKGLGVLKERLNNRGGFDVRPLKYNPADPKVPTDAAILVVANPKPPVEPKFVSALRDYLANRKGKAIVLVDTPPTGTVAKSLPPTGLEGLLGEFNVDVTGSYILAERLQDIGGGRGVISDPEQIMVVSAESALQAGNPLARAFSTQTFVFLSTRVVRPTNPPRNPGMKADALLTTRPGATVWTETDPQVNAYETIRRINTSDAEREKVVSPNPLSTAVAVGESGPPSGMPGQPQPAAKPRLVVFGDTTFISNPLASADSGTQNFSLFASTLDWLAERPTSIGLDPRPLAVYSLDPAYSASRMVLLPGVLAVVTVLGLGLGVWVVRRR